MMSEEFKSTEQHVRREHNDDPDDENLSENNFNSAEAAADADQLARQRTLEKKKRKQKQLAQAVTPKRSVGHDLRKSNVQARYQSSGRNNRGEEMEDYDQETEEYDENGNPLNEDYSDETYPLSAQNKPQLNKPKKKPFNSNNMQSVSKLKTTNNQTSSTISIPEKSTNSMMDHQAFGYEVG